MIPAARPIPLWIVSHCGIDLAVVAAVSAEGAVEVVSRSITGRHKSKPRALRIGTARIGQVAGIVRAISSRVAGRDEQDIAAYFAALTASSAAVGVTVHAARRSRHPRCILARWAAWFALSETMSLAAIGRASGHDHTSVRYAIPLFRKMLASGDDDDARLASTAANAAVDVKGI